MEDSILLSAAYFPPVEYFSLIAHATDVQIEKWENYHKQTYRNRCTVLGSNGSLALTVPVKRGSFHKTPIRELEIDDSRRWREVHLGGIISGYATAPYFEYYFDMIEEVITGKYKYLLDLNMALLNTLNRAIGLNARLRMTDGFVPQSTEKGDFRYLITPKKKDKIKGYTDLTYTQVFSDRFGFVPGLSIIDMLFNNGPGTKAILLRSLE